MVPATSARTAERRAAVADGKSGPVASRTGGVRGAAERGVGRRSGPALLLLRRRSTCDALSWSRACCARCSRPAASRSDPAVVGQAAARGGGRRRRVGPEDPDGRRLRHAQHAARSPAASVSAVARAPIARFREEIERAARRRRDRGAAAAHRQPRRNRDRERDALPRGAALQGETKRPVIAQMMGVGASGAYYVAMAADEVHAYPSTITGSIGVIIAGLNFSGLMDKLRRRGPDDHDGAVQGHRLAAPSDATRRSARSCRAWRAICSPGSSTSCRRDGRSSRARASSELADGRIYSANQALDAGLIDAIGDLPSAVEATKAAARHRGRRARRRLPPAGRGAREPVLGSDSALAGGEGARLGAAARSGVPVSLVAGRASRRLSRPTSRPGSGRSPSPRIFVLGAQLAVDLSAHVYVQLVVAEDADPGRGRRAGRLQLDRVLVARSRDSSRPWCRPVTRASGSSGSGSRGEPSSASSPWRTHRTSALLAACAGSRIRNRRGRAREGRRRDTEGEERRD